MKSQFIIDIGVTEKHTFSKQVILIGNNLAYAISMFRRNKHGHVRIQNPHQEEIKYMIDHARFPPGVNGLPKHMHFVTTISSDSLERRNRKEPTP